MVGQSVQYLNVTLQYIGITVAAFLIVAMAGGIDVVAIQAPTVTAMDFFSGVGPDERLLPGSSS